MKKFFVVLCLFHGVSGIWKHDDGFNFTPLFGVYAVGLTFVREAFEFSDRDDVAIKLKRLCYLSVYEPMCSSFVENLKESDGGDRICQLTSNGGFDIKSFESKLSDLKRSLLQMIIKIFPNFKHKLTTVSNSFISSDKPNEFNKALSDFLDCEKKDDLSLVKVDERIAAEMCLLKEDLISFLRNKNYEKHYSSLSKLDQYIALLSKVRIVSRLKDDDEKFSGFDPKNDAGKIIGFADLIMFRHFAKFFNKHEGSINEVAINDEKNLIKGLQNVELYFYSKILQLCVYRLHELLKNERKHAIYKSQNVNTLIDLLIDDVFSSAEISVNQFLILMKNGLKLLKHKILVSYSKFCLAQLTEVEYKNVLMETVGQFNRYMSMTQRGDLSKIDLSKYMTHRQLCAAHEKVQIFLDKIINDQLNLECLKKEIAWHANKFKLLLDSVILVNKAGHEVEKLQSAMDFCSERLEEAKVSLNGAIDGQVDFGLKNGAVAGHVV